MPKALRTCLTIGILLVIAAGICLAVWVVGSMVFGLPTLQDSLGPPAADLTKVEEVLLSFYLMLYRDRLDAPAGDPRIEWTIEVEQGESAQSVIDQLDTIGILSNPLLFRSYIRFLGFDRGIESGKYDLSGAMSIRELAEALQSARLDSIRLVIPEGWRLEQIGEQIDALGLDGQTFVALAKSPPADFNLSFNIPMDSSLEGYLFPDTYSFEPETSPEEIVNRMLMNFDARVDDEIRRGLTQQGLSLHQGVILASIVEREAVVAEERPRIAAVFLNRLSIGMNLDADPTVQYAMSSLMQGDWWPNLTLEDLQIDSFYNTYRYPNLPPGPIASPGLDSLRAVAFPLTTSEYYFRALCDGSGRHAFAETFEQHQLNSCP
jgi:UPF0755 protein